MSELYHTLHRSLSETIELSWSHRSIQWSSPWSLETFRVLNLFWPPVVSCFAVRSYRRAQSRMRSVCQVSRLFDLVWTVSHHRMCKSNCRYQMVYREIALNERKKREICFSTTCLNDYHSNTFSHSNDHLQTSSLVRSNALNAFSRPPVKLTLNDADEPIPAPTGSWDEMLATSAIGFELLNERQIEKN